VASDAEREELERKRRALPHYVTVGGQITSPTLLHDLWVTKPRAAGTDLASVPWRKVSAVIDTGCTLVGKPPAVR
jgi:hypothetical protein